MVSCTALRFATLLLLNGATFQAEAGGLTLSRGGGRVSPLLLTPNRDDNQEIESGEPPEPRLTLRLGWRRFGDASPEANLTEPLQLSTRTPAHIYSPEDPAADAAGCSGDQCAVPLGMADWHADLEFSSSELAALQGLAGETGAKDLFGSYEDKVKTLEAPRWSLVDRLLGGFRPATSTETADSTQVEGSTKRRSSLFDKILSGFRNQEPPPPPDLESPKMSATSVVLGTLLSSKRAAVGQAAIEEPSIMSGRANLLKRKRQEEL